MSTGQFKSPGNGKDAPKEKGDSSDITMTVKVIGGKHLKGSKGEHVNSLVRVQFADYDFKDV